MFCCRELHTQGNTPPSPELAGITRYPLVCVEHFLSRCQLQPSDCMVQTHFMQTWWLPLLSALSEAAGVVARVATVGSCHGGGGGGCSGTLTTSGQRHTLCGGQHMVSAYTSTLFVLHFSPLPSSPSSPLSPLLRPPSRTILSPGPLLCLTANPDTQTAIAQLTDGTILKYDSSCLLPWQLPSGQELKFPEQACDHITLATFNRQVCAWVLRCGGILLTATQKLTSYFSPLSTFWL